MKCHFRVKHGPWDQEYGLVLELTMRTLSNQKRCQQECDGATLVHQKKLRKYLPPSQTTNANVKKSLEFL